MTHPIFPELEGRKAVVTGGAGGIGRAIVEALRRQKVSVALCDIDPDAAGKTAAETGSVAISIDVRKRASVEQAFAEAEEKLGGFDMLFANAGVSTMQRALDLTDEEWDFNFDVNTRGIFLTNQIAGRRFKANGKGVIVNTASLAAKVGAPFLAHYSASKFAVLGWTQALAKELAGDGIRVNAICPGLVKTAMQDREVAWEAELRGMTPDEVIADYIAQTPLGRLETAEDVADVAVFLSSNSARFMTGQGVNVTGGIYMT